MNIFLVPASLENLRRTINQAVSVKEVQHILKNDQLQEIQKALNGRNTFNCWAMTENSRTLYMTMEPGDIILMSGKRSGLFNYFARVLLKIENEPLGRHLWSYQPNLPWKLIYFLEDLKEVNDLKKSELLQKIGYSEKDNLQKLRMLKGTHLKRFHEFYSSIFS